METQKYELKAIHDVRQSFYNKAVVEVGEDCLILWSYNTKVAEIRNGKARVFNDHSQTTLRHIKEFLKQNGFIAENKKQILNDYN